MCVSAGYFDQEVMGHTISSPTLCSAFALVRRLYPLALPLISLRRLLGPLVPRSDTVAGLGGAVPGRHTFIIVLGRLAGRRGDRSRARPLPLDVFRLPASMSAPLPCTRVEKDALFTVGSSPFRPPGGSVARLRGHLFLAGFNRPSQGFGLIVPCLAAVHRGPSLRRLAGRRSTATSSFPLLIGRGPDPILIERDGPRARPRWTLEWEVVGITLSGTHGVLAGCASSRLALPGVGVGCAKRPARDRRGGRPRKGTS